MDIASVAGVTASNWKGCTFTVGTQFVLTLHLLLMAFRGDDALWC